MDADFAPRTRRTPRRLAACAFCLALLAGMLTLTTQVASAAGPAKPLPGLVGSAVAVSGSTVVVGAPLAGKGGQVDVYGRAGGTWSVRQVLADPSSSGRDEFGFAVAISGSTMVVGAPFAGGTSTSLAPGAAYVYARAGGTWSLQASLEVPAGATDFGSAVAVTGSSVMVGASELAVFLFTRTGSAWQQAGRLSGRGDGNVASLAMWNSPAGPLAGFGAPFGDPGDADVFALSGGTWGFQAELLAPVTDFAFGSSMAGSGNLAVVGAPDFTTCGAAFVYRLSGKHWTRLNHLRPQGCNDLSAGGSSVAISGSTVLVGAPGTSNGCGEVYAYQVAGRDWTLVHRFKPHGCVSGARFGNAVGLAVTPSGPVALIGAPGTDHGAGAFYQLPF